MPRQRMRFSANCIIMMQDPIRIILMRGPIRIILMRGPIRIRMTGSREADCLFPVMARFCPSDMNTSWRGSSVGFVTKGRGIISAIPGSAVFESKQAFNTEEERG